MWTLANGEAKHGETMFTDTEQHQEHNPLIRTYHSKGDENYMVEKITINPTKVRAYGNIIGTKTSTSYDTYNAEVTGITDTVNGEVVAVMEVEYDDTPRSITTLNL